MGLWILLIALGAAVTHSYYDDAYVIDGFDVPEDLAAAGYTSEVVPRRVHDAMLALQASSESVREFGDIGSAGRQSTVEVQVAGFGLSIDGVAARLRSVTGRQARVFAGEVTRTGDSLVMALRQNGLRIGRYAAHGSSGGVDSALHVLAAAAAEGIYRVTEPYLYAILIDGRDSTSTVEAARIARQLAYGEVAEEKPWGLTFLGNSRLASGDTLGALEAFRTAHEADPDFYLGYANLANLYLTLDQPRQAHDVLRGAAGRFSDDLHFSILAMQWRAAKADSNLVEAERLQRRLTELDLGADGLLSLASLKLNEDGYAGVTQLVTEALERYPHQGSTPLHGPALAFLNEDWDLGQRAVTRIKDFPELASVELLYDSWLAAGRGAVDSARVLLAAARRADVEKIAGNGVVSVLTLYLAHRGGDTEEVVMVTDSLVTHAGWDLDPLPGIDWYNETLEVYRTNRPDSLAFLADRLPD